MDQSAVQTDNMNLILGQWQFQDPGELDQIRQELLEERRQFEEERRQFEQEKKSFLIQKNIEDRRIESERHLFEMKWQVLETELRKLADEKEQIEKRRNFYKHVRSNVEEPSNSVSGDMFFVGVCNERSLKKRYKDLIKIYHPDNEDGDTWTIQEINREYDRLKQQYE